MEGTRSRQRLGRLLEAGRLDAPVVAWSVLVGALAGFVGGSFRFAVARLDGAASSLRSLHADDFVTLPLSVVGTVVAVVAALLLVRRFAPEAAGSGIQEIEGALDGVRPLRWARVLGVKFGAGLLSLGAGMVMGREGPTVQMGGAVGQMLRERFRLSDDHGRVLVAAGAGAGLTAAFNAPLAGMLFVIEEMRPHFQYNVISVQCVLIACATSDIVVRALLGGAPAIAIGSFGLPPLTGLWIVAAFGAGIGVIGVVFNAVVLLLQDAAASMSATTRTVAAASVAAVVGWLAVSAPDFVGGGYSAIFDSVGGDYAGGMLLVLFAGRFALTTMCFATGVPGGIFAPMIALGTIVGMWFADVVPASGSTFGVEPGVFVLAGSGALFAATVRAPLTGIVLVAELTGNFPLVLPVAVACISATLVAHALGGRPIYTLLLERTLAAESGASEHGERLDVERERE